MNNQNKSLNDETFVELMNRIINDEDAGPRIRMVSNLVRSLQILLYYPRPVLEQLLAKLEIDYKFVESPPDFGNDLLNDIAKALSPVATKNMDQCLGLLKAYLDIRPYFVDAVRKNVPTEHFHRDWEFNQ